MGTPVPRKFAYSEQSGPVTSYFLPPEQIDALLSKQDASTVIEVLRESIQFEVPLILGDTPSIYSMDGVNGRIPLDLPDDLDFNLVMQHTFSLLQAVTAWLHRHVERRSDCPQTRVNDMVKHLVRTCSMEHRQRLEIRN